MRPARRSPAYRCTTSSSGNRQPFREHSGHPTRASALVGALFGLSASIGELGVGQVPQYSQELRFLISAAQSRLSVFELEVLFDRSHRKHESAAAQTYKPELLIELDDDLALRIYDDAERHHLLRAFQTSAKPINQQKCAQLLSLMFLRDREAAHQGYANSLVLSGPLLQLHGQFAGIDLLGR